MPESNSEKIRRLVGELARIRNELRGLVSEPGAARGALTAGTVGAGTAGDPLDEILSAAPPTPTDSAHAVDSVSDDTIVVDISLPARGGGAGVGTAEAGTGVDAEVAEAEAGEVPTGAENQLLESERNVKPYPKKPPPRKHR